MKWKSITIWSIPVRFLMSNFKPPQNIFCKLKYYVPKEIYATVAMKQQYLCKNTYHSTLLYFITCGYIVFEETRYCLADTKRHMMMNLLKDVKGIRLFIIVQYSCFCTNHIYMHCMTKQKLHRMSFVKIFGICMICHVIPIHHTL